MDAENCGCDDVYTPGPILRNGTVWAWRDAGDGHGGYVDTARVPTASERFSFALEPVETPFVSMLRGRD